MKGVTTMAIVPLTTPLPIQILDILGLEALGPFAWLFAGVAVLVNGIGHRRNPVAQDTGLSPAA
jgi:hypothetical protein